MRPIVPAAAGFAALLMLPGAITPALARPVPSAPPQAHKPPPAGTLSDQDKGFLKKVAKGGMMQVQLSEVAAQQTQNPKVRKFAVTTIANMAAAGGMLHAIAAEAGMKLPTQPPPDVKKLKSALAADHGHLLDNEYMAQIVPASTVAVNLFKTESGNGKDPQLVRFAKMMLPKIEHHQRMAVRLSENMGVAQAQKETGYKPPPAAGSSNAGRAAHAGAGK